MQTMKTMQMMRIRSLASAAVKCIRPVPKRSLRGQAVKCQASPTFFVGGNWKCNGTVASVSALCDDLNKGDLPPDVEVVVAPSFIHLGIVKDKLCGPDDFACQFSKYKVAAQNCWEVGNGAYTGEVSAEELVDFGITWVILGHSERRALIHETNELIAKKTQHALEVGLNVIACIGETLEERNSGNMFSVLEAQMSAYVEKVKDWDRVVIAYEPVWAIGTGVVATPEQAQEVHLYLRKWLRAKVGEKVASTLRIIYGGSANDSNCNSLAVQPDIDGFLVGGASLKGTAFIKIIQSGAARTSAAA